MFQAGEWIKVRGARVHNLQNVDVDLPRGCLTVITGPSGSGKSSLAFDTLYAEGRRRYLETLRVDTRALFDQLQRPDVDVVDGLPPTLCVSQQTGSARPRSTLATITEIHDHLRLLWSRLGIAHCYQCSRAIRSQSAVEIIRETLARQDGSKLYILAPLVRSQKGEHKEAFQQIRQGGFLRARVDGVLCEIRDIPRLNPKQEHTIELVVDRLVLREGIKDRLTESLDTATRHGGGIVIVTDIDDGDWHDQLYSTRLSCPTCNISYPEMEPRRFSFNNPAGACPKCNGLGYIPEAAEQPADEVDDIETQALLHFPGFVVCLECRGTRLNREARSVRFADKAIHEVTALSVDAAHSWFRNLPKPTGSGPWEAVATSIISELTHRLHFLQEVGLGYLTLDRPAPTLSGGELQRARLATYLGGGLLGVCYILDEPTIGLHPRDTDRLLAALRGLQQRGNTLLVVEHDETLMRHADYLVDIGPGAGKQGGKVLATGIVEEVMNNPCSVTAPFLRSFSRFPKGSADVSAPLREAAKQSITIRGARQHNLKNIDVTIPLGQLVCVTGVSGSGKSSLVLDILCNAARKRLGLLAPEPGVHDGIDGLENVEKVIEVDQTPLGRSARSNAATYTGAFDEIRKVFATTRHAKVRGYKANRFSFNTKGGRCEQCQGQGELRVALQFLPDLTVLCPLCRGRRYNRSTLEVVYKSKSIADVLAMSVDDAVTLFENVPAVAKPLRSLADVGLGYIALGQSSSALSGGEAQRVKLAAELMRSGPGRTLFVLDEPTTGLHFSDVANLLRVFSKLVEAGNTLVVIEHNLDVIAAADWVIDLGPEGGEAGGHLVVAGTPRDVAACPDSVTGRFLRA